jgi:hypothetical protein
MYSAHAVEQVRDHRRTGFDCIDKLNFARARMTERHCYVSVFHYPYSWDDIRLLWRNGY